jgi:hypothetical protein
VVKLYAEEMKMHFLLMMFLLMMFFAILGIMFVSAGNYVVDYEHNSQGYIQNKLAAEKERVVCRPSLTKLASDPSAVKKAEFDLTYPGWR